MSEFDAHLSELTASLERRRSELLAGLAQLHDEDLVRARRGGWTIGKVLEHVIGAEWHYARLARNLRGLDDVAQVTCEPAAVTEVVEALSRSRAALLEAIHGITEPDFYRLGSVGPEEYSVVSVLENVEQHDVEHLGQIRASRRTLSESATTRH
jgi:uncharacterized damage-inducible protein DinB